MKKRKWLSVLVVFTIFFLSACAQSSGGNGEKVVNIGYSGPLSGAAAYYGENTLNGLKMAVEDINKEGFEVNGDKYKLNVVALDDKYLPNETASNGKRLVQENQTPIIFSPHSGGISALQVFNEVDNFIVSAYSSEPDIVERGNTLTVRIPPSYEGYIEPFSDYAMDNFGKKLAAIPPVTQYGKDWAEAIIPYWESAGGEVVHKASVDYSKDTDFFTLLTNALKEEPDVLFIGGPSEPTAKIVSQARQLGYDGGFIVMDQAKLDEMKNVTGSYDVLEGAIGVVPLIYTEYSGTKEFIDKYREKHDKDPGSEAGYHYLAMYVFVEAMKAAGSVDDAKLIREHIEDGLTNLPDDKKVYDLKHIEENGAIENFIRMGVIKDGEFEEVDVE
ncbi:ABC transporter substrate-binding protein [Cytobacillus sp. FSL W7-1323]|uniref:ABC transporter substrate-binding protein n=1 Tax=Cytobacillus TaxID=2675230 RepID=UPI00278953C8|nr:MULTISPECIES: ABC transporter substrate-binding protein [Cytobacillus]MDQ0184648.1 branched-chain amino acid transport system substrate-binding protein [Cytobacillus kochii]MEA1852135.1 ABC transporter substrate-binding protein [Cytobacillus sp. OWB-43]MED1606664.1 ABC transporter substrate-binding protein [Cytobacillus kochii]